jgi:hypothetical protein
VAVTVAAEGDEVRLRIVRVVIRLAHAEAKSQALAVRALGVPPVRRLMLVIVMRVVPVAEVRVRAFTPALTACGAHAQREPERKQRDCRDS